MLKLNLFDHPICFAFPNRLTAINSWHGHIPFAMFLVEVLRPKTIVELGTHLGDSYCAFCQAVRELRLETRCYAVDTWRGDPQAGEYGPEVLADLRAYHDPLYGSFSRLIQSTFDEALLHFEDKTIDILHIDGYHIYEMVKHDFESWLPKVSPQGVILLHDINVLERDYGARRFWEEIKVNYPSFEFLHGHGLGIVSVGEVSSEPLQNIFNANGEEIFEIREFFSQMGNRIISKIYVESSSSEIQNKKKELIVRDSQIVDIKKALENKESELKAFGVITREKDKQIGELGTDLLVKNSRIDELKSELKKAMESEEESGKQIDELTDDLQGKNSLIDELRSELIKDLESEESKVKVLEDIIEESRQKIGEMSDELQVKNSRIEHLWFEMNSKNNQIIELNKALQAINRQVRDLQIQLYQIQHGILMQLRNKYQRVIERILPQGTRSRYYYQLGLRGIRVVLNEGWRSFWRKYRRYKVSGSRLNITVKPSKLEMRSNHVEENIDPIDRKISIIIPTKNAGLDFEYSLERIRNQKGIKEIELIVVDSGSSDVTLELAKKYGANIFCIKPEDFNHGLTRNLAAQSASGDYIVFMVQDAIPIGDLWLYKMVEVVEENTKVAAVTCRQVPRSDANLFACYSLWNHYRTFENGGDKISWPDPGMADLPPIQKRKLAGLEDVCCLIRTGVFSNLKFTNTEYAEDLELGLKILDQGYGLAFLFSNGVIHSHNRSPSYLLKRSYVENKLLPKILSYKPVNAFSASVRIDEIFSYIETLYAALNLSLRLIKDYDTDIADIMVNLKTLLKENSKTHSSALENYKRAGNSLDTILNEIQEIVGEVGFKANEIVFQSYLNSLDGFADYLQVYKSLDGKQDEFLDAMYQLFAIVAGSTLANCYLDNVESSKKEYALSAIDSILSKEV